VAEEVKLFERNKSKWEDDIKLDPKGTRYEPTDWIQLGHGSL
jgi:hypothetical protein